jgi:hypothetical protein
MSLNGWQRIGIVVSIVWLIGGGLWGNSVGLSQGDHVSQALAQCLAAFTDWAPCSARFEKDWPEAVKYHWHYAAAFALIPIPLGWLVCWGLLNLVRWIRAGFKRSPSGHLRNGD